MYWQKTINKKFEFDNFFIENSKEEVVLVLQLKIS